MGRTKTKPFLKRKKVPKLYFHFSSAPPVLCTGTRTLRPLSLAMMLGFIKSSLPGSGYKKNNE
jgi:hypothetical protein